MQMNNMARLAHHETSWAMARRWVQILRGRIRPRPEKLLRLSETLSLGERRFVAVVEFERQKFLIGGTASSVCLLARLGDRIFNPAQPHPERQLDDVWP
jgi:flagellar biogenesis protein FliO